jgi:2-polyprenyl-6-methoxyphenol hydroxylase-like FAD-dependent oxidoreductase
MDPKQREVVIVGAGPAGMMLAYQLVSSGVKVRVLERHPDFQREFCANPRSTRSRRVRSGPGRW